MSDDKIVQEINETLQFLDKYAFAILSEYKKKDEIKITTETEKIFSHLKKIMNLQEDFKRLRIKLDEGKFVESGEYIINILKSFNGILLNDNSESQIYSKIELVDKKIQRIQKENKIDELVKSLDYSHLLEISPTKAVYAVITKLFYENKITETDLNNLISDEWCQENFCLKKAAILPKKNTDNEENKYIINGVRMYFSHPYVLGVREYYIYCLGTNKIKERLINFYKYKMNMISLDEYLQLLMGDQTKSAINAEEEVNDTYVFDFDVEDVDDDIFDDAEKLLSWINKGGEK